MKTSAKKKRGVTHNTKPAPDINFHVRAKGHHKDDTFWLAVQNSKKKI